MTIYGYLATLKADPLNPATSPALVFAVDDATPAQVEAANGLPYVIVEHLDETTDTPLYQHERIVAQLIDVSLFQAATSAGSPPDRTTMIAVWNNIQDAVHNVTQHTYKRTFIELSVVSALEPRTDRETGGLFGSVRFRILFARG